MAERNFKYERPRHPDQYLEALYEEVCLAPRDGRIAPTETLKDLVGALFDHARRVEWRRQHEEESRAHAVTMALTLVAAASIVCLFIGFAQPGEWAWLNDHRVPIRLLGIALAALFVGASIERSSFIRCIWGFAFTKLVVSLALSALVVFSTGKASALMNAVFPVDASALPFTRALVTGMLAVRYLYPVLFFVAVVAVLHAISAIDWTLLKLSSRDTYAAAPVQSFLFLLLSLVILGTFTRWVNVEFSDEVWPAKVYQLAHELDFNAKYECGNLRPGLAVVFLGPGQDRVLVDLGTARAGDMKSFIEAGVHHPAAIAPKFFVLPCEPTRLKGAN